VRRQPAPPALNFLIQDGHRVPRGVARKIVVPLDRLLDDSETVLGGTVIQVDVVAVQGEGLLDLEPEILIGSDLFGTQPGRASSRLKDPFKGVDGCGGQRADTDRTASKKSAPVQVKSVRHIASLGMGHVT
jgi:hypothetical protein